MARGTRNKKINDKRANHVYINFDRKLVEIVDFCVTHIFQNGGPKYTNRKDFFVKSVQYGLEKEKEENIQLRKILVQMEKEALVTN